MEKGTCSSFGEPEGLQRACPAVELAWEEHREPWSEPLHTFTMQVTLTWVPRPPGEDSELPEPAWASPDPRGWSLPGAGGWLWGLRGGPLCGAPAALSRELLLELGAVVSRCCCSEPGAATAFSAGR